MFSIIGHISVVDEGLLAKSDLSSPIATRGLVTPNRDSCNEAGRFGWLSFAIARRGSSMSDKFRRCLRRGDCVELERECRVGVAGSVGLSGVVGVDARLGVCGASCSESES